ncbi:MAG: alpha/beta hydrolase, partial [Pseudorhodobacter sp.]|nr:alpha/beta hydrolase [Pseudorhodobacter sp.]
MIYLTKYLHGIFSCLIFLGSFIGTIGSELGKQSAIFPRIFPNSWQDHDDNPLGNPPPSSENTMTKPDYQKLIDPEIWSFIEETGRFYPENTATFPVEAQRDVYDRMCEAFRAPRPEGIVCQDETITGVPVRHYLPAVPRGMLVYFHGGGFVVGGLHSHDDVCAEIAAHCRLHVVSVDYRLAPEHVHPAAFDDALSV